MVPAALALAPASLIGTYQADVSHAPAQSRGTLATIYQGSLHLHPDGTFDFSTLRQSGFWRRQGNRLVLVHSGFFGTMYPVPDAVLRRRWPKGELEGIVLDVRPDGTLSLPRFGRVAGPLRFKKVPRRSTLALLRASFRDTPESMAAFMTLTDEIPAREGDLLRIIGDPRMAAVDRRWSTFFIEDEMSPAARLKATGMLLTSGKELAVRERKAFFHALSTNLLEVATPAMMPSMLDAYRMGRVRGKPLADAIGRLKYEPGISILRRLAVSEKEFEGSAAVRALGAFPYEGAVDALTMVEHHPEATRRIAYYEAVLGLSREPERRRKAVEALGRLLDKAEYQNKTILEALGGSGERAALPILVARLERGDDYDRRIAAAQIARLGFPEGVPALLAIKQGPSTEKPEKVGGLDRAIADWTAAAPLRKAVAEALYAFDQRGVR
ncbi:MAG: HEAT repeat domain-containing protein [Fimbriimonas sp.]